MLVTKIYEENCYRHGLEKYYHIAGIENPIHHTSCGSPAALAIRLTMNPNFTEDTPILVDFEMQPTMSSADGCIRWFSEDDKIEFLETLASNGVSWFPLKSLDEKSVLQSRYVLGKKS